jgi:DNA-binding transcriptional regulator GbsR (MarR family)
VDANPAYEDFFSDFYKEKMELLKREVDGDMDMWELAMRYFKVHEQIKSLTEMKTEITNKIKNQMKNKNAYSIKFGPRGKISFNKRFYANIKPDADEKVQ